jgi:hypothetical protein
MAEKCGRATKSGRPCQNTLPGTAFRACSLHETPEDIAYREGYQAGAAAERGYAEKSRESSRELWIAEGRRLERAEAQEWENFRTVTTAGEQVVVVDGRLTYRWAGEALKVGDRVLLPGNWLSEMKYGRGPFSGTVTGLGSSYQGELSPVLRKISDDPED